MKLDSKNKKKILLVLTIVLIVFLFVYIFLVSYSLTLTNNYKEKMYPNVYINNYNISNIKIEQLKSKIDNIYYR